MRRRQGQVVQVCGEVCNECDDAEKLIYINEVMEVRVESELEST